MLEVRTANECGCGENGWLSSRHAFSFTDYFDPHQIGFSDSFVVNDGWVAPGQSSRTHPNQDTETLSYVIEGASENRDSTGRLVNRPVDVRPTSACMGIAHSEYNHSSAEPSHFLQIWIAPALAGTSPRVSANAYGCRRKTRHVALVALARRRKRLVRCPIGRASSRWLFNGAGSASLAIDANHHDYVHVGRGDATVNGIRLRESEGTRVRGEWSLTFAEGRDAEVPAFDLPDIGVFEVWA
jgi:redox-sensitive bicupin YhaK (pirin superfamily)